MISIFDLEMKFAPDGTPISGEIVFTHVDDKTGEVRHFAVQRIEKWLRTQTRIPIIEIPIDPVFAYYAMTYRGIEQHRFERISKRHIKTNPITLAFMPGVAMDTKDSHLIIDGNHRYCKAAALGMKSIRGYELQPEHWEPFLVDVPEDINDVQRHKIALQAMGVPINSHIP